MHNTHYSVYAKVNVALQDLEPELVCVNLRNGKSEGMGVITCPTYSFSTIVNLQAARKALSVDCVFSKGITIEHSLCYISKILLSAWISCSIRMVYWA